MTKPSPLLENLISSKYNFEKMLTNYDLENLCQYYNVPLVGCFMKNELPKKYTKGNYIINLESAPSGGSHWTKKG